MAYGTSLSSVYSVICPDGSYQVFWNLCPSYGTWGTFRIGLFDDDHYRNRIGAYGGDDGYRPPQEPEPDDDGTYEVVVADKRYQCRQIANLTMVSGAVAGALGVVKRQERLTIGSAAVGVTFRCMINRAIFMTTFTGTRTGFRPARGPIRTLATGSAQLCSWEVRSLPW